MKNLSRDADRIVSTKSHTHEELEQLMKDHDLVEHRAEEVRRALQQT